MSSGTPDWLTPLIPVVGVKDTPNPVSAEGIIISPWGKAITVPALKTWQITYIFSAFYAGSGTGNANLNFIFLDSNNNIILKITSSYPQPPSTTVFYVLFPGCPGPTFAGTKEYSMAMPYDLFLPAGYKIKILAVPVSGSVIGNYDLFCMANEFDSL